MPTLFFHLAQQVSANPAAPKASEFTILIWVMIFIAVLIVLTAALMFIRKWFSPQSSLASDAQGAASMMETMRRLQREGKMSAEEFDQIRAKMAAKVRAEAFAPKSPNQKPSASSSHGLGQTLPSPNSSHSSFRPTSPSPTPTSNVRNNLTNRPSVPNSPEPSNRPKPGA